MRSYPSALPFVDPTNLGRLPDGFLSFLDRLGVEVDDRHPSQLRMRAAAMSDWWFCWVEGSGSVRVVGDRGALCEANWDFLLYSARGLSRSISPMPIVPAAGQILLSRPDYAGDIVSNGPFGYLIAFIPPSYLSTVDRSALPYGRPVSAHSGPGAVACASLRALVSSAMDQDSEVSCSGLLPDFANLVVNALRQTTSADELDAPRGNATVQARLLARVLDYIELHLGDPALSVAEAGRACGLSERSIHRGFAQLGESFGAYLHRLRLEKAAGQLVASAGQTVTTVAYDCGFSSPSAFCRAFQREYGVSPKAFAKAAATRRS